MSGGHAGQWDDPPGGGEELCGKQAEVSSLEGVAVMEYVIGALWSGLDLFGCILFHGAFLPQRDLNKRYVPKILAIWIFCCIYTNIPMNQYVKLVLSVTVYTVLSVLLLRGAVPVHICLAIVYTIFNASMDTLAIHGMCYLLGISYNTFVWRKLSYITLITTDKLLMVFLMWILYHFRKKGNLGKQRGKWVQLSIPFPAVSAAMLAILFYTSPRDEDVSISVVVFAGIIMIANAAMLYVINSIEKATEQEQELQLLRQQISIQTENYAVLRKSYSVQRKSTHEFQRHIQVLQGLLDRKEYMAAQEYVRQLRANRALKVFSIASNNPVIDVVLNQKYQVAQEHEIKMYVKVNDLSSVAIKTNELVVLLSNLLDNAIEACLKLEQSREIVCSILKEDNMYISIRNTSAPVVILHGEIPTTKKDAAEHGYGLQAVKYILNQLEAEYTFAYNDGWFQFVAEIPE